MLRTIKKIFNLSKEIMSSLHDIDIPSDKATFAMGCFWAPDSLFGSTLGVISTRVGYAGGTIGFTPTYRNIGDYTEAIHIVYDPKTISYKTLLKMFWDHHDPTAKFTKQYSSYIFYHSDEQKLEAEMTVNEKKKKGLNILTEVQPAEQFFNAEDYHQKYRLQQHKSLCRDLGLLTGADFINSHVAARLNGYVVGQGGIKQFDQEAKQLGLDEISIKYIRQLVIKYEGQGLTC
ncbi:peptide methionine sulfoxide reductase isoform X2 [Daktulosphaira vitifoliae]|uniref:peptide methionine sulfoxide reductase isoform X2 n=1 Tax=Daktulosphaira vitifoliae TaxID=58002 RepID=UPI0021AA91A4|nr:peptide methionine sulfoxide reductase isoform X2 [Daktulosphaira vitifoliae]